MNLYKKIFTTIHRTHLIKPGDKILVGVSGGADSIALLDLLSDLRVPIGFQIHVAHINHHLRLSADADQHFVERFCSNLNLPCTVKNLNLSKKCQQGGSVEEIARDERLKALINIAKKIKANTIALAHHRDDLAETVLLRILRGTGLQGLQAILPKRKLYGIDIIRPLLDVCRKDIETYLKIKKIKFRTDPTNRQIKFFRNKIRLQLLPHLKKNYQKNITEILCNLAVTAGEDYDYLRQETLKIFPELRNRGERQKTISISLPKLQRLPTALKRMSLRFAYETINGDTTALTLAHLRNLEDLVMAQPKGTIVHLPHGISVQKNKNGVIFLDS